MYKSLNLLKQNLEQYFQKIKNISLLSKDEEYILAKNFKELNDITAIKILVESNLNYVIKIAKNYTGYGILIKDLIQVGIIGLIKAIQNFNPEKKIRLISFAIYWIKSEIHEYIVKNIKIVKIANTKNQKKIFFNLKKFKKIGWLNTNEKIVISNLLNVKKHEIDQMELSLNKYDIAIEFNDTNFNKFKLNIETLSNRKDPLIILENNNWKNFINIHFKNAFNKLDKRSQNIITLRWLNEKKYTLKKLSKIYKISSERIRQIELKAIMILKNKINIVNKNK